MTSKLYKEATKCSAGCKIKHHDTSEFTEPHFFNQPDLQKHRDDSLICACRAQYLVHAIASQKHDKFCFDPISPAYGIGEKVNKHGSLYNHPPHYRSFVSLGLLPLNAEREKNDLVADTKKKNRNIRINKH